MFLLINIRFFFKAIYRLLVINLKLAHTFLKKSMRCFVLCLIAYLFARYQINYKVMCDPQGAPKSDQTKRARCDEGARALLAGLTEERITKDRSKAKDTLFSSPLLFFRISASYIQNSEYLTFLFGFFFVAYFYLKFKTL